MYSCVGMILCIWLAGHDYKTINIKIVVGIQNYFATFLRYRAAIYKDLHFCRLKLISPKIVQLVSLI